MAETILLVENESALRDLMRRFLEGSGYEVLNARDGDEALSVVTTHPTPIDLLLTDVVMPKISGPELAERLSLPVLYMSGYTGDLIEQHEMLQPGVAYIQKPFSAGDLKRKVRDALDEARDALPGSAELAG